jgi:site-specific recombinase XerD
MNASELALHLKSYLSYRESLGHKQEQRGTLRRFVNEYARDCPGEPITTAWLLNWITADQRSAQTQAGRLSALRGFLRYVHGFSLRPQSPTRICCNPPSARRHIFGRKIS